MVPSTFRLPPICELPEVSVLPITWSFALGEAVPIPTRLKFYPPDPPPNSDDIDFYEKWKNGLDDVDVGEIVKRWRRQER